MNESKTRVEINEDLLSEVDGVLSTTMSEATIEEVSREILCAQARREEVEALVEMRGMDLTDEELMVRAWRA